MSKYKMQDVWKMHYGDSEEALDYAGRLMKISACGNPNSRLQPTFDHIRPLSDGGADVLGNIVICHRDTNWEKGDRFPHWKANERRFHAERVKGTRTDYIIIED